MSWKERTTCVKAPSSTAFFFLLLFFFYHDVWTSFRMMRGGHDHVPAVSDIVATYVVRLRRGSVYTDPVYMHREQQSRLNRCHARSYKQPALLPRNTRRTLEASVFFHHCHDYTRRGLIAESRVRRFFLIVFTREYSLYFFVLEHFVVEHCSYGYVFCYAHACT